MSRQQQEIVRKDVTSVSFGMLSTAEIRNLSCVECVSPLAFDALGNALPGGVYDLRMGPTEPKSGPCLTCSQPYQTCPGHLGHIELAVPVYNPLMFPALLKMLKVKCQACHSLKTSKLQQLMFEAKLNLINRGLVKDAMGLDDRLASLIAQEKKDAIVRATAGAHGQLNEPDSHDNITSFLKSLCDPTIGHDNITLTSHERSVKRTVIKELMKSNGGSGNKCQNCSAFSPRVRQDASNKIFLAPLSQKMQKSNEQNKVRIVAASRVGELDANGLAVEMSDNDSSSDSEDSMTDESDSAKKTDRFMTPLEAMAQARLTWQSAPALCAALFGSANNGSDIFFMRTVAVPPSRFRPPMVLGNMTVEHSQNNYLNKLLTLNQRIRDNVAASSGDLDAFKGADESDDDDGIAEALRKAANTASQTLQLWIDLQLNVNCYFDSAKDPSANAANAPPGIRQLLERKEGIFRKHMMGKRVNYACRSVISPDPYIGTNEIGIPLKFAKTLTYPTPVTPFNVEKMRNLVTRGPENYPGAVWVEEANGRRFDLGKMSEMKREAVAARLLSRDGQMKVGRQLENGDTMLVNRQVRFAIKSDFLIFQCSRADSMKIFLSCTTPKIHDGL